jgi:hypothetical protein
VVKVKINFDGKIINVDVNKGILLKRLVENYGICFNDVLVIDEDKKELLTSDTIINSDKNITIKSVVSKG